MTDPGSPIRHALVKHAPVKHAPVKHAMIQAAGFGTRLRPLTETTPKPLIKVKHGTLLDRAIDTLGQSGVEKIAVNTHYLADQIEMHLEGRSDPEIHISHEEKILDTGGGIKKACRGFPQNAPVFCMSSDWYWEDESQASEILRSMSALWAPQSMDILLLLAPRDALTLTTATGDYDLTSGGKVRRSPDKQGEYMWTSVRIFHPRIFEDSPDGAFSFLDVLDRCEEKGRLYAHCLTPEEAARWHHISTMEDYQKVSRSISPDKNGRLYENHG